MSCSPSPHSGSYEHTLLDRIRRDRFSLGELSHGGNPVTEPAYRRGWNACSANLERAYLDFVARERMERTLADLRDVPAMDLRLKHALVSQSQLEHAPLLAASATPAAREVAGEFGGE